MSSREKKSEQYRGGNQETKREEGSLGVRKRQKREGSLPGKRKISCRIKGNMSIPKIQ